METPIRVMQFETRYEGDKPQDWVLLAPVGENVTLVQTWRRVSKLIPKARSERDKQSDKYKSMQARWDIVGPAYEAWKAGNELPENGTPLAAWAGVTPEQAKVLKQYGINTVELVTSMTDATIAKLRWPGARKLPELAKEWLESKDKVDTTRKLQAAEDRIKAMEEMLAEAQKGKRGPGRPRKDEAAA